MKVNISTGRVLLIFSLVMMLSLVSALNFDNTAYYKLDATAGNVLDAASSNVGLNIGATRGVSGIILNAFSFDGNNDEVTIANNEDLNFDTGAFTINLWVNTSGGNSGEGLIAKHKTTASFDGFTLRFIANDILNPTIGGNGIITGTTNINDSLWKMITWTRNATGHNKLYVNATQEGATVLDATNLTFDVNMSLGVVKGFGGFYEGEMDEIGIWKRGLTQAEINELYSGGAGKRYGNVLLVTPLNNTIQTDDITFNVSLNSNIFDLINATLFVWYINGTSFNVTTNSVSGNDSVFTTYDLTNFGLGDYLWNVEGCYGNGIGVNCSFATNNNSFEWSLFSIVNESFNVNTVETKAEEFKINVSYNTSLFNPTVLLHYNGTNYTTSKVGSGSSFEYSRTIDIPISAVGNASFHWFFTDSMTSQTAAQFQNVTDLVWTLCNSSYTNDFLNITFKDETSLLDINASVTFAEFIYYLGSGSVNKSFTFSNNTNHFNYTFCASPDTETVKVIPSFQYEQMSDYPQRIWNPTVRTYTSTLATQILYLLKLTDGAFVTFQVLNPSNQQLTDVSVEGKRLIDGVLTTVANGVTDSAGSVQFFLDGDFEHTFTFTKTGLETLTLVIFPNQAEYTVVMGTTDSVAVNDLTKGITINILPSITETLFNGTTYNFNMTIATSFWDLDGFNFTIETVNGTILSSATSSSSSGGTISVNQNTLNHTLIVMKYTYTINSTTVTQVARWVVLNSNLDDWSIKTFFTDFTRYVNSGIFGLDDFGVNLIIFMILFFSVGIVSFKFGFTSPMAVSSMVFAIIYFFDVAVGILPTQAGIPNFLTFLAALILIGVIFREATR